MTNPITVKQSLCYLEKKSSEISGYINDIRKKYNDGDNCISPLLDLYNTLDNCKTANLMLLNAAQKDTQPMPAVDAIYSDIEIPRIEVSKIKYGYKLCVYEKAPLKHKRNTRQININWQYYTSLAIKKLADTTGKISCFSKALLIFDIHHPLEKLTDYFDVDNLSITPIINNLKGTFFRDDSREQVEVWIKNTVTDEAHVVIMVLDYSEIFPLISTMYDIIMSNFA